jgi:hypothetical protein
MNCLAARRCAYVPKTGPRSVVGTSVKNQMFTDTLAYTFKPEIREFGAPTHIMVVNGMLQTGLQQEVP